MRSVMTATPKMETVALQIVSPLSSDSIAKAGLLILEISV